MSRIDDIFTRLRGSGQRTVIPYVTAGHPSLEVTRALLPRFEAAGAAIIELGIPFSDPIADGPIIASAMHRALSGGVRLRDVLQLVAAQRASLEAGLIAMVSHSVVHRAGLARFVAEAADAGFDGLIVPDVDLAKADILVREAERYDLSFALLVAPTTPEQRLPELLARCRGFVYVLARMGITGETAGTPQVKERIAHLRRLTDLPLAVGFGISSPRHVAEVTQFADAAIVGSAIVRTMESAEQSPVDAAERLVRELVGGVHSGAAGT